MPRSVMLPPIGKGRSCVRVSQPSRSFYAGQCHVKPFIVATAIFAGVVAVSLFFTGLRH